MSQRVYERQAKLWPLVDLQALEAQGKAQLLIDHDIWIVQLDEGGKVAVRPDQILVNTGFNQALMDDEARAEFEAENAWLTHAEAPTMEDLAFDDYERSQGMVSFEDAYDAADPAHAAGRALRHAEREAFEVAVFKNGRTSEGLDDPKWQAFMEAEVVAILARQGTTVAAEEAKVDAVLAAQGRPLLTSVPNADDLLAKFTKPKEA